MGKNIKEFNSYRTLALLSFSPFETLEMKKIKLIKKLPMQILNFIGAKWERLIQNCVLNAGSKT